MSEAVSWIREQLLSMGEEGYRLFQCKLMPTVDPRRVIGIRTPQLRRFSLVLSRQPQAQEFLRALPHFYYEENNLHGFLIERLGDYRQTVEALHLFLPYVDNWATCDAIHPRVFSKNTSQLLEEVRVWMASQHPYTVRFGIGVLMREYLDEHFSEEYLEWVASVDSEHYYVRMMVAWYFATALAKQYDFALKYLQDHRLPLWVHNKTVQKAVESYRLTDAQKALLRKLRRKE